jgi:outer membrane receptor protein involved in Fe transport
MRSHPALFLWFGAVLFQYAPISVHAAETPAATTRRVTGTVKDSSGRPVSGAHLRLEGPGGQIVARTQSDTAGHFAFLGVVPGTYAVVASKTDLEVTTGEAVVSEAADAGVLLTMESAAPEDIVVIAKRLNRARNEVYTTTGASVYGFSEQNVEELPRGEETPLNDVLLQAPGAAQDSFGQLHVRGDHANLQYRLDGIALPEGVNGFAQVLTPRFANHINLITGALPAQYGLRTAGVVDIQTRSGFTDPIADLDLYGGQRETFSPTLELGGSQGKFAYYGTASYYRSDRFIEPPTPGPTATGGGTQQGRSFADLSYLLNENTRLTFLTGTSVVDFGLPTGPGVPNAFQLEGVNVNTPFPSINLRDEQTEENYYNVLALQGTQAKFDYQAAAFSRYSKISYFPDDNLDIIFNGVTSTVKRSSFANGGQVDTGYHFTDTNTLRAGAYFQGNKASVKNSSSVFPADAMGNQTSTVPFTIIDNTNVTELQYGMYIQDEWRPLEKLTLNYGARLEQVKAFTTTGQLSPRVAATYQLTPKTLLHAGYSRYYTPPPPELISTTDIAKFQHTTGAVSCVSSATQSCNTTVSPDRAHYYDVGATQQLLPGVNVGLDGYYRLSRHVLDEGQFGQALVFSPFNYKKGQIYGVEGTATYTSDDLSGYMNFAYAKALGKEVVSGQFNFAPDELAFINRHYIHLDHDQTYTASGGLAYRYRGYQASATVLAGSGLRSGFVNSDHLPYYIQTDLGLEKGFAIPHMGEVRLRAAVVNLFDNTYQIRNGSGIGVQSTQYGPRRTFFFGVNIPLSFGAKTKGPTS